MELFDNLLMESKEAQAKLPEALSKQKNKFLIAINKVADNNWSKEDDDFVNKVIKLDPFHFVSLLDMKLSLSWNDTYANDIVKSEIEKNAVFQLPRYLESAKVVFLVFSGLYTLEVYKCINYVLTHARRFGDPSQRMFTVNNVEISSQNDSTEAIQSVNRSASTSLPSSKFKNRFEQLINDLGNSYDETKFKMLNVNVTYIALLMLRRVVKNETEFLSAMKKIQTHDNYVKLCPWPLDNLLPKSNTSQLNQTSLKGCAYLAIHAYLNVPEDKTKRVLQGNCVQHMQWCGLQLPHLFFKVAEIYNIEAGELWDHLSLESTARSLIQLANDYYNKNEMLKEDPLKTQNWFPYCRVLCDDYHRDLSASQNMQACYILAHLVDFKIGSDKSKVRLSHWAKSMEKNPWSKSAKEIAKKIYEKYT